MTGTNGISSNASHTTTQSVLKNAFHIQEPYESVTNPYISQNVSTRVHPYPRSPLPRRAKAHPANHTPRKIKNAPSFSPVQTFLYSKRVIYQLDTKTPHTQNMSVIRIYQVHSAKNRTNPRHFRCVEIPRGNPHPFHTFLQYHPRF